MNDAYGDPRNYDPNDQGFDPYGFDPTWGAQQPDQGQAPPPQAAPTNWSDPDTAPPDWLRDAGADMSGRPLPAGLRWVFQDGMWQTVQMPRGNTTAPPPVTGGGGFDPYGSNDYHLPGSGDPFGAGGGRKPGEMLPFPQFQSAGPFTPRRSTFEFDPYTASSWTDAENEPGYKDSRLELRKMTEQGAANRGVLRSGATIGEVYKNLDALGQQNFSQFDNRRYRNWSGNRDLAASKFGMELGVDRDVYDRGAADIDRGNNYRYNVANATFGDDLARWQEQVRSLTTLGKPT